MRMKTMIDRKKIISPAGRVFYVTIDREDCNYLPNMMVYLFEREEKSTWWGGKSAVLKLVHDKEIDPCLVSENIYTECINDLSYAIKLVVGEYEKRLERTLERTSKEKELAKRVTEWDGDMR